MNAALARPDFTAPDDGWSWWQARRLRYNLGLAAAGWGAYLLTALMHYVAGEPIWGSVQDALSLTLFLGAGFLALMGAANIFYLLGPIGESVVRPADVERFRRNAYGMGFWGSVALPFLFPLISLAVLIQTPSF